MDSERNLEGSGGGLYPRKPTRQICWQPTQTPSVAISVVVPRCHVEVACLFSVVMVRQESARKESWEACSGKPQESLGEAQERSSLRRMQA